jgi:hypothetical protein
MRELICDAIGKRLRLSFTYLGQRRVVEPHLCGRTEAGDELMLGYVVAGHSSSGPLPGWRNYRLSEMHDVQLSNEGFENPRPGFNPQDPRFAVVFCQIVLARVAPE